MSKWNLTPYFASEADWDKAYESLVEDLGSLSKYKGNLGKGDNLKLHLEMVEAYEKRLLPLYGYAHQNSDLDQSNALYGGYMQKMSSLFGLLGNTLSFYEPEIIKLGEKNVEKIIKKDKFLMTYQHPLEKIFHNQKHILSDAEEAIIANFSPIHSAIDDVYNSIYNVDRENEVVTLSDGSQLNVSVSNWRSSIANSSVEEDRGIIFAAAFKRFADNKHAFANLYHAILLSLQTNAKNRHFDSALLAKLDSQNIPVQLFLNLIEVASENTAPIKRYLKIRQKALGLKTYHTYDRFLNLAKSETKYTYEQAKSLFFESLQGLNEEYVAHEHASLEEGYVDSEEQKNKRSGAYSTHFWGYHPYILLNHDQTLDSVFTVAHEAGHSAHSIFSAENQPYATHDYEIFVAEIASTFNEHLLLDYLLEHSTSKNEKIELIEKAIDNIMSTFYRQTLFASYEYQANLLVEQGKPINPDSLSQIMIDLYQQFYGLDITKEPGKQYVWAYIPHLFHTPFYVYQYATSFAASLKFYEKIKHNEPNAMSNYLTLLKSGSSQFSVPLVMQAGVDLTTKEPFLAVVNRFNELLDKLEAILKK
jgi:oligoendopeptidase F